MLVVDANIALTIALSNPLQKAITNQFQSWHTSGERLVAPTLWLYEVTSGLTKGVHFGQIKENEALSALALINSLPIELLPPDEKLQHLAFQWTLKLKRAAAYDSFYLALATQYGCTFWTLDKKLVNAANQPWVKLLEA